MSALMTSDVAEESYRALPKRRGPALLPEPHAELSLPQMVAAQAIARPNAPAVVGDNEPWTYGELDRRANQLANRLMVLGVKAETIVALCLERSPESVMCALAVMRAGGAFLPLDPAYPIERLAFMLNDAQPRVLIAREDLSGKFPEGPWNVIDIDRDQEIEKYPSDAPANAVSPDQLAYVIYTSGSTGQPKGVEITHESLMNLVSWHQREFAVSSKDKASHLASVGFDAAIWEAWPYLTAGASLHLPDETTRVSPELLRDWLIANEITISFLPTALAERVMTLNWPDQAELRFLLTGADTLHRYPALDLPFTLVNNYGPTECTVVATSGRVLPADNNTSGLPTIGQPIAKALIYILDENLQQVSSGTVGEICLGGACVARGYLNRPDLTAEKFIPDPFSKTLGARLYRTGDLARRFDDGQIAYVGRVDEQIKILGYRIEPTEIEAAIDRHSAIATSVVIARGVTCDEKLLAAYITTSNGTRPSGAELRSFLRETLPDYMVPAMFVKLAALPLTVNGKVDRAALPEPTVENTLRDDEFTAPQSSIEKRVAKILCSLLNLNEVSLNDNFFLLGGHSLLGTQLIVKIRGAFGVDLALRTLFDAPTVAELSGEIERLIVARIESMSEDEARALLA